MAVVGRINQRLIKMERQRKTSCMCVRKTRMVRRPKGVSEDWVAMEAGEDMEDLGVSENMGDWEDLPVTGDGDITTYTMALVVFLMEGTQTLHPLVVMVVA